VSDPHKIMTTHSHCVYFSFAGTDKMAYIQSVIVEISLQAHRNV